MRASEHNKDVKFILLFFGQDDLWRQSKDDLCISEDTAKGVTLRQEEWPSMESWVVTLIHQFHRWHNNR